MSTMELKAAVLNAERGYSIDRKRIVLAYGTETVVALASLYGAFWFGLNYGHDMWQASVMMLAPLAFAIAEFGRVPLAITVRTNRSWIVRAMALLGVLAIGCITVKSMSQLGEMMFRPRLFDVVHAKEQLQRVQQADAVVVERITAADRLVSDRRAAYDAADQRAKSDAESLGNLPKEQCSPTSGTTRDGRAWHSVACKTDARIAPMLANLKLTVAAHDDASQRLDAAIAARHALDRGEVDQAVATATVAYREALMHSQLHAFASMVFGVTATEVTDQQINNVLRFFVFLPAVCVALVSSLLAFSAVQHHTPGARLMLRVIEFVGDVQKLRKTLRAPRRSVRTRRPVRKATRRATAKTAPVVRILEAA
jgi:hypothetical protein